ncbi:MAG: HupE/UreJ family protein [Flavisolibacter sp.]
MDDFRFYFQIGWEHIMNREALDHLFFIAALAAIYMLRDWKQVLVLVTAFTIGHTITLILSTRNIIEVDSSLVEFLIPCTIIVTAISNLFQKNFTARAIRINYFLALFFGLIHGLAFANTLRMIIAEDQSFALSMFGFSVGLELGQILVVFVILLLSQLFVVYLKVNRKHWVIFVSAAVFALALEMAAQRWPGNRHTRTRSALFLFQKGRNQTALQMFQINNHKRILAP